MKFFLPLFLLAPILLHAQSSSSGGAGLWDANHFLWFTGHWSKSGNKKTFIIDKGGSAKPANPGAPNPGPTGPTPEAPPAPGTPPNPGDPADPDDPPGNPPGGGTITFQPDGTVNLNNGSVDAWNKRMDQALANEQKYLQGLQNPGDNLDPTTYRYHQLMIPDVQQRVNDIKAYKIDPSADMLGSGDNSSPPAPARSVADVVADGCKSVKPIYDEVMNYYNTQVKGHNKDLKYPPPPVTDFDCYSCDSNLRKQYDTTTRNYARDFAKDEIAIARKGFDLLHDLGLVGINTNMVSYPEGLGDLFSKNKKDPSKSGACAFMDIWALSDACYGIAHHVFLRAEKMMYDNKTNYQAAPAIIRTYLEIHRSWCLISGQDDDASVLPMLHNLLNKCIDHYLDELRKDDWRQIANFPLILSMIRDEELMGNESEAKGVSYYNEVVKIINSFKLSVEMEIKIGVNNGYKLAHLKGECHIIPSFQQDSNQCYKWVVADESRQEYGLDGHGFYMAKELQTIDVNLLNTGIVAQGRTPKYTGTKKYTIRLASLSMDFCHPGNDTIDLTGFTANPPTAGTWLWPNGAVSTEGEVGMEQYFEDVNAKKRFANDGEAQKAKDDLKTQAEKLRIQMEALKAQMSSGQAAAPPGGGSSSSPGSNYEKMMEFKQQALSKIATPIIAKLLFLNFLLPVRNNDPVLVDKRFNAKEINPQEANVIVYGYYTIHIENDANGAPQKPGSPASPKK